MFINGEWVDALSGNTFEVFNPATGERLDSVPDGAGGDAAAAVAAAHEAFPGWASTTAYHRSELLYRAWELMTE
ncbi:MAG: aldehyde dehydrogenase family protein, partial [Acidimicrobiales bacterium]